MAIQRSQAAATVESPYLVKIAPTVPSIPELDEANAAVKEARARKLDRKDDKERAQQAAREAATRKRKLEDAVDRGEHVEPAAIEAEDEAIRSGLADAAKFEQAEMRADAAIKDAEQKVRAVKKKEVERLGRLAFAASETARKRGDDERAAWHAECNRLAGLYTKSIQTSDKTVDADLDALSEFAR